MKTWIGRPFAIVLEPMAHQWLTISDSMQFGIHAALGPTNQATAPPFLTQGSKQCGVH